jgi:hypothetical protein
LSSPSGQADRPQAGTQLIQERPENEVGGHGGWVRPITIPPGGHSDLSTCRVWYMRGLAAARQAQCLGMMNFTEHASVPSHHLAPVTDQLRLAVAAYLARFKGSSRDHTRSDLR